MATHHAKSNEVVDLKTWAQDIPIEKTKAILKTKEMELARLVLPAGKAFKEHQVDAPITVQCIEGHFLFTSKGCTQSLTPNQLLYLESGVPHSLQAVSDSIILLTIAFTTNCCSI